ncbi:uncharacterized protein LOC124162032 [Ischnura elegans]|uniref:uncharacterized protein LOC124162032 n=1 Tax=Ischnura elegans TaxID=197161 RepID=UPI001ED8B9FB|nr:uncharacterized protein LOC124162032 [Ischnura elegans]
MEDSGVASSVGTRKATPTTPTERPGVATQLQTLKPTAGPPAWVPETPRPTKDPALIALEYYRTYDAMTGIRIAATLGGFFSLMVFMVVYKSKCRCRSSRKSHISEEELAEAVARIEAEERAAAAEGAAIMAAVAAAAQEQGVEGEEAPLEAYYALMARSGFSRRAASFSIPRHSLASFTNTTPRASCGNCAAAASSFRQRSLQQRRWGSGSGPRMPRRRRGKSLPGYPTFGEAGAPSDAAAIAAAVEAAAALTPSTRHNSFSRQNSFSQRTSFSRQNSFSQRMSFSRQNSISRHDDDSSCCYLEVPRRLSSVGSGSVSSYLEKRGSVVLLGLPPFPPPPPPPRRPRLASPPPLASHKRRRKRRDSSRSSNSGGTYPIDINVIQPTPDVSPRGSERQLAGPRGAADTPAQAARVLAPLASYGTGGSSSSAASSLSSDCVPPPGGDFDARNGDFDARSVGSDSVFFDESSLAGSRRASSVAPISSDSEEGPIPQPTNLLTVPQGAGGPVWERAPHPSSIKQSPNFLMVPSANLRPTASALPRPPPPASPRPPGRWTVDGGFSVGGRKATAPVNKPSCETISAQVSALPQLATTPESPPPAPLLQSPGEDVRSACLYRPFEAQPAAERPTILRLDATSAYRSSLTSPKSQPTPPLCLSSSPISDPLAFPMFGSGSCEQLTVPDKGSRETLF